MNANATQEIRDALTAEYKTSTYQAIGKRAGVSGSYVRDLIVGRRSVRQITLDVLLKLFPRATISLDGGGGVSVSNSINSGQNIHVSAGRCDLDAYRGRLVMALAEFLPAEWLAKAIEAVKLTEA